MTTPIYNDHTYYIWTTFVIKWPRLLCNDHAFYIWTTYITYGPCLIYMGRAMRKCIFGLVRTAKSQISLHIRAVWSGTLLSAKRIIRQYRRYQQEQMPGWDLAHVRDESESVHFGYAGRHVFVYLCSIYGPWKLWTWPSKNMSSRYMQTAKAQNNLHISGTLQWNTNNHKVYNEIN